MQEDNESIIITGNYTGKTTTHVVSKRTYKFSQGPYFYLLTFNPDIYYGLDLHYLDKDIATHSFFKHDFSKGPFGFFDYSPTIPPVSTNILILDDDSNLNSILENISTHVQSFRNSNHIYSHVDRQQRFQNTLYSLNSFYDGPYSKNSFEQVEKSLQQIANNQYSHLIHKDYESYFLFKQMIISKLEYSTIINDMLDDIDINYSKVDIIGPDLVRLYATKYNAQLLIEDASEDLFDLLNGDDD